MVSLAGLESCTIGALPFARFSILRLRYEYASRLSS
jgi:hypothetical protein